MKFSLATVLALALLCGAPAGPPPARAGGGVDLSIVRKCLPLSPNGSLTYVCTIIGEYGPVAASLVQIVLTVPGDTLACWCGPEAPVRPHVFAATTGPTGVATFAIQGGGCGAYGDSRWPGINDFAGEVFADGVRLKEVGIMSPDPVDSFGREALSTPTWNPAGTCGAALSDAVRFTTPLANGTYDWCTDMNCDNSVGLSDATILTPFLAASTSCAGDAGPH